MVFDSLSVWCIKYYKESNIDSIIKLTAVSKCKKVSYFISVVRGLMGGKKFFKLDID